MSSQIYLNSKTFYSIVIYVFQVIILAFFIHIVHQPNNGNELSFILNDGLVYSDLDLIRFNLKNGGS